MIWYVFSNSMADNITDGQKVTVTGVLVSKDLSAIESDGPGVFIIQTSDKENITVELSSGESACNRDAIRIPNVEVGGMVKASGDRRDGGVIQICERGTYIE
jgi:hypothetical protein